jgi:Flp pilus assembly pilin Flp
MKLNQSGQSLVEYLVLICLIAVSSVAVVRTLSKNINVQFANVARSLGGESHTLKTEKVDAKAYSKTDFNDFMQGANSEDKSSDTK